MSVGQRPLKNLLISLGSSYHPAVRLLHGMVKDKSDSYILMLKLVKSSSIRTDLREDCSVEYDEFKGAFDLLRSWLLKNQFELIGISFMSHHWDIFVEITRIIRQVLPDCRIIAGGVHAWRIAPEETLKHCDYVCAAEGEEVYSRLVDALSFSKLNYPLRIPGLIEKNGEEIINTAVTKEYMSMDNLPVPTMGSGKVYSLSSLQNNPIFVNKDPQMDDPLCYVHVGRGCLFKCTFCINSLAEEKNRVRLRPVEKVIEEIKFLIDVKNPKAIIFMDEMFPLSHNWLEEFALKYKSSIGLPFSITLYPGMLTYEKTELLKKAGLREVSMGLQSGSEYVRKNVYNRHGTNDRIIKENAILSSLNIISYYDMIIKSPFESEKDYRMNLELLRTFKRPFYLKFYTLAFYPGHPITKKALDNKLIEPKEVSATRGYLDVTTPHKVAVVEHYLRENQLVVWHRRLIKETLDGVVEAPYCLIASYYGFWFIPRFVSEFVWRQFLKERKWVLYIFASVIQFILVLRNNLFIRYVHITISSCREKGFIYILNKICRRVTCREGNSGKRQGL
jgi:radical SAM superfamily enzyme YgiQ (UPF0313 family)